MPVGDALLLSNGSLHLERDALESMGIGHTYMLWKDVPGKRGWNFSILRWMLVPSYFTFQVGIVEEIQRAGARVLNVPRAVMLCDKLSMHALWHRHLENYIGMSPTIITARPGEALEFAAEHGHVLLKPLDGQGGQGVREFHVGDGGIGLGRNQGKDSLDSRALRDAIDGEIRRQGGVLVQAYVKGIRAELRTMVAGGEVVGSYCKLAGGGLHNLGHGAILHPVPDDRHGVTRELVSEAIELAFKIQEITGLDILALDTFITSTGEHYLNEWNPFFAYGGTREIGLDVASRLAEFVARENAR